MAKVEIRMTVQIDDKEYAEAFGIYEHKAAEDAKGFLADYAAEKVKEHPLVKRVVTVNGRMQPTIVRPTILDAWAADEAARIASNPEVPDVQLQHSCCTPDDFGNCTYDNEDDDANPIENLISFGEPSESEQAPTAWDFIERFYPAYSTSDQIALVEDMERIVEAGDLESLPLEPDDTVSESLTRLVAEYRAGCAAAANGWYGCKVEEIEDEEVFEAIKAGLVEEKLKVYEVAMSEYLRREAYVK